MQILNNQTNLNFNGTFKIKPSELQAQTEIPALFTQGMQKFTNIEEKGDMFIVVRDNYDKRIGNYLSENHVNGVKYYPTINTKSGLDDEKPEGLLALLKDKSIEVKTELDDIFEAISKQKRAPRKAKLRTVQNELEKISNVLRLNIENPEIITNKNFTRIRDSHKNRTIELISPNNATTYVYVKPDSLNEDSIKCILDGKGNITKIATTPNDIHKFMKTFSKMKKDGENQLV